MEIHHLVMQITYSSSWDTSQCDDIISHIIHFSKESRKIITEVLQGEENTFSDAFDFTYF